MTRNTLVLVLLTAVMCLGVGYSVGTHRCRSQPASSVSQSESGVGEGEKVSAQECAARMTAVGNKCVEHIHKLKDSCASKLQACQQSSSTIVVSQEWSVDDEWTPSPCYSGSAGCP